jgi:hypothetical protein
MLNLLLVDINFNTSSSSSIIVQRTPNVLLTYDNTLEIFIHMNNLLFFQMISITWRAMRREETSLTYALTRYAKVRRESNQERVKNVINTLVVRFHKLV